MTKSKIDIIYDMVNLAYDVKRQCGRDKTLNYYIGDYARDVIKAKDEKVYDEFIYLAKQLEEEGWEEFIDCSKNLIKEYNQIEESKKSSRKSIKESDDDNWYKLKVLNEMLDAMVKDEYNIPKVGIYGVTKNINLNEGAIRALIKYYK